MPSTDLSAQKWDLRGSINLNKFTKSGQIKIPGTYRNPLLRVELRLRGLKASWNQIGYLHQVHAGATHPKGHYLAVHDQILQLANLSPYGIFIQLVPWAVREAQSGRLSGSLRFFESGTILKSSDLSNLDSFHRQQMSLVNPISIQFPPEMDNSTKHTRSIAVTLVAGVSSVLAPVNDNRTGMVLRNPGAFDVYLCLDAVAAATSAIAVLEPNGFYELAPSDYNGAVSVICPAGAGSIAGSEMASVSFAAVSAVPGMTGYAVPNTPYKVRFNSVLSRVERSLDSFATVENINDSDGILGAKIATDGQIHVSINGGVYFYSPIVNGSWVASDAATYDSLTAATGAIVL